MRALLADDVMAFARHGTRLLRNLSRPEQRGRFFQKLYANVGIEAFEPRQFVAEADRVLVIVLSAAQSRIQVGRSITAG